jgi:hypothetical protein
MKRKIFAFALVTIFAFVGALAADSGPADKLVGTWEGTLATEDSPRRRLLVESVKRDGDQLVGVGRFGNADKGRGGKVDINITVNGNDVALEFFTPGGLNNRVQLKLVSDKELTGDVRVFTPTGRMVNADIKLKKIN